MKILLQIVLIIFPIMCLSQNKLAYEIFDKKGKKVTYDRMIRELGKNQIILFGEYHDDPIIHWLQLELTIDFEKKTKLQLGFEMLEADNQLAVNDYLEGKINQKQLDTLSRLWNNYKTDYKPLVDFAKAKKIPVIATNIPRRFANKVYKEDFGVLDQLSDIEKTWIAPLPILYDAELPSYKNMLTMMGDHPNEKLPKAQAIKDATMAYFIMKNFSQDKLFIHFNGSYHSDNYEGIYWYLKEQNPTLKVGTISVALQKDLKKIEPENVGKADFIIVVNANMTRTYK